MSERKQERQESAADYFVPAGSGSRHLIFPGVEITTAPAAGS